MESSCASVVNIVKSDTYVTLAQTVSEVSDDEKVFSDTLERLFQETATIVPMRKN
jgi:hypothetical protein